MIFPFCFYNSNIFRLISFGKEKKRQTTKKSCIFHTVCLEINLLLLELTTAFHWGPSIMLFSKLAHAYKTISRCYTTVLCFKLLILHYAHIHTYTYSTELYNYMIPAYISIYTHTIMHVIILQQTHTCS